MAILRYSNKSEGHQLIYFANEIGGGLRRKLVRYFCSLSTPFMKFSTLAPVSMVLLLDMGQAPLLISLFIIFNIVENEHGSRKTTASRAYGIRA